MSLYIAAAHAGCGKAVAALGMTEALSRQGAAVGVFRPVVRGPLHDRRDELVETLRARFSLPASYAECVGVTYQDVHADPERARAEILAAYQRLAGRGETVVVVGTDQVDAGTPAAFGFDARLAARLGTPVLLLVNGSGRSPAETASATDQALRDLLAEGAAVLGVVVTRVARRELEAVRARTVLPGGVPVHLQPDLPRLRWPTIGDLRDACGGYLMLGEERLLTNEASGLMVGAMSLPNILDRLTEGVAILIPSDRAASLLPGLLAAHAAPTFPALSGIIMTGGMELPEPVARLLDGMSVRIPVIITEGDTFETATRLSAVPGRFTPDAEGKIEAALDLFARHVAVPELLSRLAAPGPA